MPSEIVSILFYLLDGCPYESTLDHRVYAVHDLQGIQYPCELLAVL